MGWHTNSFNDAAWGYVCQNIDCSRDLWMGWANMFNPTGARGIWYMPGGKPTKNQFYRFRLDEVFDVRDKAGEGQQPPTPGPAGGGKMSCEAYCGCSTGTNTNCRSDCQGGDPCGGYDSCAQQAVCADTYANFEVRLGGSSHHTLVIEYMPYLHALLNTCLTFRRYHV